MPNKDFRIMDVFDVVSNGPEGNNIIPNNR